MWRPYKLRTCVRLACSVRDCLLHAHSHIRTLQVPRIVAGDNLDLPLLGTLFKKCGAFFIRRDAASKMDVSYKAALRGTVGNVLTAGHTLEASHTHTVYIACGTSLCVQRSLVLFL
jgi:hypothetical protein